MKTFNREIQDIINETRGRGNTTWILKSAIDNPEVILMFGDRRTALENGNIYCNMVADLPWWKRYWRRFTGKDRIEPLFTYYGENLRGMKRPIVFDISAINKGICRI